MIKVCITINLIGVGGGINIYQTVQRELERENMEYRTEEKKYTPNTGKYMMLESKRMGKSY